MSYTGMINIENRTGQKIIRGDFNHKSSKLNSNVSFGKLESGWQTSDFSFQSTVGTVYDTFTITFYYQDGEIHNKEGERKTAVIKCLWGKNDNGKTGHIILTADNAAITTPAGNNCSANFS